ncbi:MAG TPA: family 1 glycosylhydrolase [Polyangiaceae bacterium]|nr:family 1 glycosylhydrolase [Polyangiaceae bacterium]
MTPKRMMIVLACAAACSSTPPENFDFPQGFLFGTAIAGFQADMGCPSNPPGCTDPNSDWYTWVTKPELVSDSSTHVTGEPVTDGPGFYELYPQDLDRVANELHDNALRLSIEWSRVFPTSTVGIEDPTAIKAAASPDALAFYHGVFAAMKARGITPLVTINHYALPSWIHDAYGCHVDLDTCSPRGWLDHDLILHEIAKYAGFLAREFGGEVDDWATLNEPFTAVAVASYLLPSDTRSNPPGVMLRIPETKAAANAMIEAHARMYDAVKANDSTARVGLVYNMEAVTPADPTDDVDVQSAKNLSYLLNEVFINAVTTGELDANLDGTTVHRDDLAGRLDFLGINYYARLTAQGAASPFPSLSPLLTVSIGSFTNQDYEYPKGIYEVITLAKKWNVPIFITETGYSDASDSGKAPAWLVDTLAWTKRAMNEGANVQGYFWWTLMDNYEWNHGMTMHFGMYGVDPKDPAKQRHARQAVGVYSRITQAGSIPADLLTTYPAPR